MDTPGEPQSEEPEPDEDFTLIGGPCCGDTITPDKKDIQIRLGVVRGECLDREVPIRLKGEYTEALYARMPDNRWVYVGRFRQSPTGTYFSEA